MREVNVFETIDRLATTDLNLRNVIGGLIGAAQERAGGPVYRAAAKAMADKLGAEQTPKVLICCKWHDRQSVNAKIMETDGPPGAVALARWRVGAWLVCLHGTTPIIVTDANP